MINIDIRLSRAPMGASTRRRWRWAAGVAALALLPVLATAAPVDIPNSFADGEVISAEAFNENFDALEAAVDDNDARIAAVEGASDVPTGTVIFFDGTLCPEGYVELEAARGRAIVGMDGSSGELLAEVGTALVDQQMPMHGHSISGGTSVTSGSTSVAHTHSSGSYSTVSAGSHNHQWKDGAGSYNSSGSLAFFPAASFSPGSPWQVPAFGNTNDLFTDNDGAHTHGISGTSGAASGTGHTHAVNLSGVGVTSVGGSLPYVQLLVCRRA